MRYQESTPVVFAVNLFTSRIDAINQLSVRHCRIWPALTVALSVAQHPSEHALQMSLRSEERARLVLNTPCSLTLRNAPATCQLLEAMIL